MPLNIDWQQILLHMLNLVLLVGGLYFILYKPVKSFMDKRQESYRNADEESKAKLEHAEKLQAEYESRLLEAETTIEHERSEALANAAKAGEAEIDKAKKQAVKIIADAQKSAEHERKRIIDDAHSEVATLAARATEKLLTEQSGAALYEQFLTVAERSESNE